MSVRVHREVPADELSDEAIRAAVRAALEHGGVSGRTVDVVLVDEPTLTELHGRFLDDPTPTDVIAFELGEGDEEDGDPWGEVYVSVDRAREVAGRRGVEPARELALYCVHGTLHLVGFDDIDPEDRARMRDAEALVMSSLGYAADVAPHEMDGA
ncbi:MAG: rRNA maturation RNase YbeY [Planctomycetes bacterium]|nr:rRNA maturation RNase YbeY [Planctomycetota bacterium]MCB9903690.1 rRNA maturation RNase YbeY [Planctomycetota bacterium]